MSAVGSAVINGVFGSKNASSQADAAKQAAQTQADAQVQATQLANQNQMAMLDKQITLQQPWLETGKTYLNQLKKGVGSPGSGKPGTLVKPFSMKDMGNVMPAYEFALQEGTGAINNAADAGGLHLSSGNIQNLGKYASGLASQFENQAFNQYKADQATQLNAAESLAGVGQNSANIIGGDIGNAANITSGNLQAMGVGVGNANASGIIGASNARANGVNSMLGSLNGAINTGVQMGYLNNIFNPSASTAAMPYGANGQANNTSMYGMDTGGAVSFPVDPAPTIESIAIAG